MQSLTQKQDFLSKEILDQGYDPQQFQDYMLNHSNKQLDLNQWSLAQLKTIVNKFKNKNSKISAQQQQSKQIQLQSSSKDKKYIQQQIDDKKQKQVKQQQNQRKFSQDMGNSVMSGSVNSSLYKYFVFKQKIELPQLYKAVHLNKKNVEIKIKKYHKTSPNNIFKSTYIVYEVESSLFGWMSKRRFNDFVWLQQYLKKKYIGLPIPPIPSKTTLRSFDQKHIQYRMLMLQRFLITLINMPQVCSDSVLETFLEANEANFSQTKKRIDQKMQQQEGNNIIQSIWGKDLVLMDKHGVQSATINFYRQFSAKLLNLSSQLNILIQTLKKAANQTFQSSSSFQQLQKQLQSLPGSSIMTIFQEFFNGLGMHLTKTANFIKQKVYSIWNYETMYIQNLTTSLTKIQKQKMHMNEKYKNAMIKVTDEGSSAFISNSQPNKLIKQFQMVKQQYRTRLSNVLREMQRYEKNQMIFIAKQWSKNLRTQIQEISDWMIGCTDILTKSMSVTQGKKLIQVQYLIK